jgi:hypothetical protein
MATKKTATKKTATKKTATKKTTAKKTTAKKTATKKTATTKTATTKTATKTAAKKPGIRGGSARTAARDADTGLPPAGPLTEAAVDAAVLAWKTKQVKSKSDYVTYRVKTIVADAEEMVGGAADLPRFADIKAPISERDFTWLRLLTEALVLVGDDVVEGDAARSTLSREAEVAVEQVRAARTRLARVGVAAGVSASLLAIPASTNNPAGVLAGADRVARQARRIAHTFHDASVASALIATLEAAADRLRDIVFSKENVQADANEVNARRAALKRLAYDVMTRIGPWGLAAVGDDPTRERAYRLDNVFNQSSAPKDPAAPRTNPRADRANPRTHRAAPPTGGARLWSGCAAPQTARAAPQTARAAPQPAPRSALERGADTREAGRAPSWVAGGKFVGGWRAVEPGEPARAEQSRTYIEHLQPPHHRPLIDKQLIFRPTHRRTYRKTVVSKNGTRSALATPCRARRQPGGPLHGSAGGSTRHLSTGPRLSREQRCCRSLRARHLSPGPLPRG